MKRKPTAVQKVRKRLSRQCRCALRLCGPWQPRTYPSRRRMLDSRVALWREHLNCLFRAHNIQLSASCLNCLCLSHRQCHCGRVQAPVLSLEQEANNEPSGEKSTHRTIPECPLRVWMHLRVSRSHSCNSMHSQRTAVTANSAVTAQSAQDTLVSCI